MWVKKMLTTCKANKATNTDKSTPAIGGTHRLTGRNKGAAKRSKK